jgi:hypothetical protein
MSELGRTESGTGLGTDPGASAYDDPGFIEADGDITLPDSKGPGGKGSIITLTTVIALLMATALTVLGLGAADTAVANFDATSWLWSSDKGEIDRVNGVTARVDTRTKISDSQNHEIQITQTDKYLILRDLETGKITALDLTTLQVSAVMESAPGLGVSVALHGETAFVIDSVLGQVRQLDPRTLNPTGDAITLPKGLAPGGFDGQGLLWIGVPTEGTVVAIQPGSGGGSPKVVRTLTVSGPGHDYVLSALDTGVSVLDNTEQKLFIATDTVTGVAVPIKRPAVMPVRSVGAILAITVQDDRAVVVVDGQKVTQFKLAGSGPVGTAVYYAGHIYTPDARAGVIHETDLSGRSISDIKMPTSNGTVELEVREGFLFINAPDGPAARVVDDKHVVREVNKYENGVLGGDPPPPQPDPEPEQPLIGPPGPPQNVTSTAGNGSATITWRKANDNGAAVYQYVVEGHGQQARVGGSQRSVTFEGLTNGETYRFSMYAINSEGSSDRVSAPPVTPTSDVPDPPASVTATANPDGTVTVTWPAANGQGHAITSYRVTSISAGVTAPVGAVADTTMTIARGALQYGTQYTFTVVAINDINAVSADSPASNRIVPFNVPGAPVSLTAATVPTARGSIQVSWQAAAPNGRPITRYVVQTPLGSTNVTGTAVTLTGFADDTVVDVQVHAENAAGPGPAATASARTIGVPTVTVTGETPNYNTVAVTITPNNRGGNATCTLTVAGGGSASAACGTQPVTLTAGSVYPNNTYNYTITITNPAGTGTVNGSMATNQLRFTVVCNDQSYCGTGIWAYRTPSQQGTAVSPALTGGTTRVPECYTTGNRAVNATPWGGKNTDQWVRFQHNGTAYFPWAWAVLDGGDNLGMIPPC